MKFCGPVVRLLFYIMSAFSLIGCGGSGGDSGEPGNSGPPASKTKPNVIVIFTDDQGYGDLGIQGYLNDLKTPNIDQLARNGVRFTQGYVTAPQCSPSRAAMLTGQYQQRFGVDNNDFTPMPLSVTTLGERFKGLGYKTGIVGKWNLEVDGNSKEWAQQNLPAIQPYDLAKVSLDAKKPYFPDNRGYDDVFFGNNKRFWSTFDLQGKSKAGSYITNENYRVDVISDAAVAFIERNKEQAFYLHVAHFAPHVPMEATPSYLARFPNESMAIRRKYALASIAAVDDGVGRIIDTLSRYQLLENTIVYFISDNGAPLGDDMFDAPINDANEAWNGSKNTPLVGEKGMLTEGGIRIPFIMQWQGKLNAGSTIEKPVSSLDASYTALKAAGYAQLSELDGIDLMPALKSDDSYLNERALFWRFDKQGAIRVGKWKYLQAGLVREYLFDMESATNEKTNLIQQYPDIADSLKQQYQQWSMGMLRAEEQAEMHAGMQHRYDAYLPAN
jgi:arylsulfatase A-like enzyme